MIVFYTCKKCKHEFNIEVTPYVPAQTYGPPENCSPEEGGDIEPTKCPECNSAVDNADIMDKMAEDYEKWEPDEPRDRFWD